MDHLQLTVDKLSVDAISDLVTDDSCGAVSIFVGTTRDNFEGKRVVRLEYESYEPMAIKALQSICSGLREKWPAIHDIAIYHRLGNVPTREASVVIAISSPHRKDSLEAVSLCIDELKAKVPIWKKEIYHDGGGENGQWKQNKECESNPEPMKVTQPAIDKHLVQINVSRQELDQRIENFIKRKRDLVNLSNIHDFMPPKTQDVSEETCARVRTTFVKRSDSKGHLKVHRVNNEWGPQTIRQPVKSDPDTQSSGAVADPSDPSLPPAIRERVRDIERFLNLRPVSSDIYRRLKEMEDRIRHLEAISPEYANFWRTNPSNEFNDVKPSPGKMEAEYVYSAEDIDRKIQELEKQTV